MLGKLLFRVRFEGSAKIPRQGPLIIASNHQSHLDPPMVGLGVPRHAHYLSKRELSSSRALGWFLRSVGTIFVDRSHGRDALAVAVEYLRAGRTVIIFPEGTRTRTGHIGTGKKGVAILAHRTGAAVVPTCVTGAYECFPAGSKKIRFGRITVRYGEPLYFEHILEEQILEELLARTTKQIMDAIIAMAPPEIRPLAQDKPGDVIREEQ